jgi:hypothetical protein
VLRASGQGGPTRLFIVSDMLQNTPALSHFKNLPDWQKLTQLPRFGELSANLQGIDVSIIYLRSSQYTARQTPEHYHWWIEMLTEMGGNVVFIEPD